MVVTRRSGCRKGRGRRRTESTAAKMTRLAPKQSASVSTATAEKPGTLTNLQHAYLRSFMAAIYRSAWRVDEIPNPTTQEPNIKHQAPNTRQAPMLKLQAADIAGGIGIWTLGFLWCLELRVWCFYPGVWSLVFGVFTHSTGQ